MPHEVNNISGFATTIVLRDKLAPSKELERWEATDLEAGCETALNRGIHSG